MLLHDVVDIVGLVSTLTRRVHNVVDIVGLVYKNDTECSHSYNAYIYTDKTSLQ